jgi:hypothetical protein
MRLVLLVVCASALAAVVVWQQRSNGTAPAPAPLQLIDPAAASKGNDVKPDAPAPAPAAPAAAPAAAAQVPAAKKPAPRREVRPERPAAVTASRSTAAPATPAPEPAVAPAPVADKAGDAGGYEAKAAARLSEGDYRQAGELFEAALRNGGKASFTIVHDHSKGNFEKDPKASCVGELILSPEEIRFEGAGAGESHRFEASWTEVLDAGTNKFFGSGIGGFHVAIRPDGKYKNFNLAPKSKEKAEAKLIVDLLNANSRKTERTGK